VLEKLLVLHRVKEGEILIEEALPFILCLGLDDSLKEKAGMPDTDNMVEAAGFLSGFKVYPRAPSRIGARMGRPEKADLRKMSPAAQVLFPISNAGGMTRNLVTASDYTSCMNAKIGEIEVELGERECPACGKRLISGAANAGNLRTPNFPALDAG
jgi:DNA polymerase II large subunit